MTCLDLVWTVKEVGNGVDERFAVLVGENHVSENFFAAGHLRHVDDVLWNVHGILGDVHGGVRNVHGALSHVHCRLRNAHQRLSDAQNWNLLGGGGRRKRGRCGRRNGSGRRSSSSHSHERTGSPHSRG